MNERIFRDPNEGTSIRVALSRLAHLAVILFLRIWLKCCLVEFQIRIYLVLKNCLKLKYLKLIGYKKILKKIKCFVELGQF